MTKLERREFFEKLVLMRELYRRRGPDDRLVCTIAPGSNVLLTADRIARLAWPTITTYEEVPK